jgi:hypothetical protein
MYTQLSYEATHQLMPGDGVDEEEIEVLEVPLDDAVAMSDAGEIADREKARSKQMENTVYDF